MGNGSTTMKKLILFTFLLLFSKAMAIGMDIYGYETTGNITANSGVFTQSISTTGSISADSVSANTGVFNTITATSSTFNSVESQSVSSDSGVFNTITATTGTFNLVESQSVSSDSGVFNTITSGSGVFDSVSVNTGVFNTVTGKSSTFDTVESQIVSTDKIQANYSDNLSGDVYTVNALNSQTVSSDLVTANELQTTVLKITNPNIIVPAAGLQVSINYGFLNAINDFGGVTTFDYALVNGQPYALMCGTYTVTTSTYIPINTNPEHTGMFNILAIVYDNNSTNNIFVAAYRVQSAAPGNPPSDSRTLLGYAETTGTNANIQQLSVAINPSGPPGPSGGHIAYYLQIGWDGPSPVSGADVATSCVFYNASVVYTIFDPLNNLGL